MRWMRTVSVGAAVALVSAVGWAAFATTGGGETPVTCMDTKWRSGKLTTTSKSFHRVPGLVDAPSAIFPISVNVSATVSGGPVEFRLINTNAAAQSDFSKPGKTRFLPAGKGRQAFAYQWIEPNQGGAVLATSLRLQWRSPTGVAVHLWNGDLSVTYQAGLGACIGSL
jgi:hypothetical protein